MSAYRMPCSYRPASVARDRLAWFRRRQVEGCAIHYQHNDIQASSQYDSFMSSRKVMKPWEGDPSPARDPLHLDLSPRSVPLDDLVSSAFPVLHHHPVRQFHVVRVGSFGCGASSLECLETTHATRDHDLDHSHWEAMAYSVNRPKREWSCWGCCGSRS